MTQGQPDGRMNDPEHIQVFRWAGHYAARRRANRGEFALLTERKLNFLAPAIDLR
jgi:hypothetical protein